MDSNKTYIIADFVKILDVPRTTLKDWMTRYEEYIEFEIRGRRKIYFESSLLVLKEIAKMRKDGQAASEIILKLSCKHPVNVDIAHEIEAAQIELPVKNNPLTETLLPIVKQQNDKIERMLSHELHDAAEIWHRNQLDGNKLLKQSARWILLVIALMMTLVVAFFFTYSNMFEDAKLKSDNDILNLQNELRKQQKSFKGLL